MATNDASRTYSITEIREEITHLPEQFEQEAEAITVTRRGKPVLAILPFERYKELLEKIDALQETIEVLQDKELMNVFHASVEALHKGETIAWEDAKRELGLS